MIVDSIAQAFRIPEDKKIKCAKLREQILLREFTVSLKSKVNGEVHLLLASISGG